MNNDLVTNAPANGATTGMFKKTYDKVADAGGYAVIYAVVFAPVVISGVAVLYAGKKIYNAVKHDDTEATEEEEE